MLPELNDLNAFRAALAAAPGPDAAAVHGAGERNGQLTKPPGALGRLEDLAIWYAGWRGDARPQITAPQVIVFAGNHGVTAQGVSAFPPEVTVQMVMNFEHGGAAINQLAKAAGATMNVHALELDRPTVDFTQAPAMSEEDLLSALRTGWQAVDPKADLLVVGEMGIGNTTPAAAIACALFGGDAEDWTGRGTGVDDAGLANKTRVVAEGVAKHASEDGLEILRCLGGREIAAMAGAIAAARVLRIPVILDGFICSAAAACLWKLSPSALDHAVAGHQSAEAAHGAVLSRLGKDPLLSLGLRLGEGSGGALAINILKSAVACHSGMATFAEAGVSDG
ncbi:MULTISPECIES: nicotinate-nucleotide--dimethylbenzimidazole phosphoribosyltransferase [unclassified Ruegeria]|uniref:nicotinate-nucleotide--dimethylbenzimidazole phosphoribosyltransferase n=1 Tax=unclassified Ruegeria TaxID=2625375 RepID=UPI001487FA80|nr:MULTISPECIES: nicotinate-nucleotide--dimethylbenzimidazole phosphoribosyltransferase [unclassified Ruegeria]NOD33761.1 nicotinate-nucleotide--dimethylbenzimidazole phosphoribosyltransferase [Ruegeria sp. HKCCD7296]NOD45940.1 nicotinate-nucleotide--dimethylbenzimidazole phosphoribosyltransferase [Ruegeria sp. HKCCD5849]NOD50760.1 nicotinate-nucleotide--dimethylbenzimidazole phosphoribosyltransferase [Ruegeria sp. HKCCD5851]NOD67576.1 nicotinate-nucleotide--dimethylbenzimidazole phosphoribosyl